MKKDRFFRIVNEIKNNIVERKKDRDDFLKLVDEYVLKEDKECFLDFKGKEVGYFNKERFDEFVDFYTKKFINKVSSKKEAVEKNLDSKKGSLHTTKELIIYRKRFQKPFLYYKEFPETKGNIVAVENFESFLKIDFNLFKEEEFIYLGGFANSFVQKFLKDKEVLFFVDFDFFGIEIYNSIECKKKSFFVPDNLESLIKKHGSSNLYKKQLFKKESLKLDKNTQNVFDLINRYSKCLEQEILDVN